MTQGKLPFKYEIEQTDSKVTALTGLPLYLELMTGLAFDQELDNRIAARTEGQGWPDSQVVLSLILLNLAGGDCVSDIDVLHEDEGLRRILRQCTFYGKTRDERRELERRWRKGRERVLPSQSSIFRYLQLFHDPHQEELRVPNRAFIPAHKPCLVGIYKANMILLGAAQHKQPHKTATIDIDATLIPSEHKESLFCYKHFRAYQPLNVYWAEHDMMLYSEFRDGNVPAGYEQKRVFAHSLSYLPKSVEKVQVRSDSAGYEWDFLKYCAEGQNKRFGVIDFAVAADVTDALKEAVFEVEDKDWHVQINAKTGKATKQEWAEVCFVPNALATSKKGPEYRFIAIREKLEQQLTLPGSETAQLQLPFPTIQMGSGQEKRQYKLTALVTNLDKEGDEVIRWLRKRCGKSEEVHSVLKTDLAGGHMPSGLFGANAAWWAISILSYNLHVLFKTYGLGGNFVTKRLKAVRFYIINRPARVVNRARQLVVRVASASLLLQILRIRERLFAFHPLRS